MLDGLAAWRGCGVSPLCKKDRGFSRARCHSAVALYRARRATRAVLHPERNSAPATGRRVEGEGQEHSGKTLKHRMRLVREDGITRLRRLKRDSLASGEALFRVCVWRVAHSAVALKVDPSFVYCLIHYLCTYLFIRNKHAWDFVSESMTRGK